MKFTYTPPAEQEIRKIPAGIYNAKCLSVTDGTSSNNNPQVDIECQVETMKLRFRLVLTPETHWKVAQVRRAFGLVDPGGLVAECDTSEFVGKSGLCLVGYSKNLTKDGDPYREIVEFFEEGKRTAIEVNLKQIIKAEIFRSDAAEKRRHFQATMDDADSMPF